MAKSKKNYYPQENAIHLKVEKNFGRIVKEILSDHDAGKAKKEMLYAGLWLGTTPKIKRVRAAMIKSIRENPIPWAKESARVQLPAVVIDLIVQSLQDLGFTRRKIEETMRRVAWVKSVEPVGNEDTRYEGTTGDYRIAILGYGESKMKMSYTALIYEDYLGFYLDTSEINMEFRNIKEAQIWLGKFNHEDYLGQRKYIK